MPANLFLTGPMRCGKSSLLCRVIAETGIAVGGYFIQRLFINGQTRAFRIADASTETYIPDIEVKQIEEYSDIVGYIGDTMSWHPEVFEKKGVSIMKKSISLPPALILMDEIGRIELKAPAFQNSVIAALDHLQPVLGVLKQENNAFLDEIRNRQDIIILDLKQMSHTQAYQELKRFIMSQGTFL